MKDLTATPKSIAAAAAVALSLLLTNNPALAQTAPKVLKKVPMDFPGDAIRKGVDKGVLKTRITVDGSGTVTEVTVVDTQPAKAKVLNDTVVDSLKGWRFEGNGKSATFDLQVVLTSD